jgi:hypothetical protein
VAAALLAQPRGAAGDCAFRQECNSPQPQPAQPACRPRATGAGEPFPYNQTAPFPMYQWPRGSPFVACPQYFDLGCCTPTQSQLLYVNLLLLQSQFGTVAGGGCPACFENMRNFYCEYTCSPRQAEFVAVLGPSNVSDPETGRVFEVLRTRVGIAHDFSCAAFGACEGVSAVQKVSAMSNAEGFFAYQGQYEAIQHGAFIEFDLDSALPRPLAVPAHSCCNFPSDFANNQSANTSCPCAYCKGMCSGGTCAGGAAGGAAAAPGSALPSWYNGLQPSTIGGVWGAVAAAIVLSLLPQLLPQLRDRGRLMREDARRSLAQPRLQRRRRQTGSGPAETQRSSS